MADPKIVLYGAARPEVAPKAGPTYETKIVTPVKPGDDAKPVDPDATQGPGSATSATPAAPYTLEGEVGTPDGLGKSKDRAGK